MEVGVGEGESNEGGNQRGARHWGLRLWWGAVA